MTTTMANTLIAFLILAFMAGLAFIIYRFEKKKTTQREAMPAPVLTMPTPESGAVAFRFAGMTEADQKMLGGVIFRAVLRAGLLLAAISVALVFALQALTH